MKQRGSICSPRLGLRVCGLFFLRVRDTLVKQRESSIRFGGICMTIEQNKNGTELTVTLTGRLDTTTVPDLEATLQQSLPNVESLAFDLAGLEYISSAGLRVLLSAQKVMNQHGRMVVRGANETIREVFDITGFTDIITIE